MRDRWSPLGTSTTFSPPVAGQLIALEHQVWRVTSVEPCPREKWGSEHHELHRRWGIEPIVVVLRPARITSDVRPGTMTSTTSPLACAAGMCTEVSTTRCVPGVRDSGHTLAEVQDVHGEREDPRWPPSYVSSPAPMFWGRRGLRKTVGGR